MIKEGIRHLPHIRNIKVIGMERNIYASFVLKQIVTNYFLFKVRTYLLNSRIILSFKFTFKSEQFQVWNIRFLGWHQQPFQDIIKQKENTLPTLAFNVV